MPTSVSRFSYDGSADDVDARHLYWRGLAGNEGETLSVFQEAVIGASVVVDVGANRGLYTLTALADNPTAHVVSVEASPRTFEHLTSMIRLNGWEDRVTAVNAAAGAESGTLPFWVPRSPLCLECAPSGSLSSFCRRRRRDRRTGCPAGRTDRDGRCGQDRCRRC
ncbi:MAG: FkbM family methyltransferase [Microthrixaceae bacterium]|nr:FkbM family methyltransferase [Microthrixaceae bacterium]